MVGFPSWNQTRLSVGQQSGGEGFITTPFTGRSRGQQQMEGCNVESFSTLVELCKEGRLKEALHVLDLMDKRGIRTCSDTYARLLQGCAKMKALADGKKVHARIVLSGAEPDVFLGNHLVSMYAKCGSVEDALQVFDKMPNRNVVSWTAMITAFAQQGHCEHAFKLFWEMQQQGVKPNKITFVSILNACASPVALEQGKWVHGRIINSDFELDVRMRNALISMYARCGSVVDARLVFEAMTKRDVISWNAMIAGYVQQGEDEEAFELFQQMLQDGVKPDKITFGSILNVCGSPAGLQLGKRIHSDITKAGFGLDVPALISMYVRCGSVVDARQVFDRMPRQDVVLWNAMIAGYTQQGNAAEAFNLFWQMQREGVKPDMVTLTSILNVCASLLDLEQGKQVHAHIIKAGLESDVRVGTALVSMYSRCESVVDAHRVFDKMPKRDVVSWTAMITGYAQQGYDRMSFEVFWKMQEEGVKPDKVTFISILSACVTLAALEHGKAIHGLIIRSGFESDVRVGNALVSMYARCGSVMDARRVFDRMHKQDVVSWNGMITGYVQQGQRAHALDLFWKMQHENIEPDKITFTIILTACASPAALEQGKQIHAVIIRSGFRWDVIVGNALVSMYARCGSVVDAHQVFDKMLERDVVSWTAMIAGYAQHGYSREAYELFCRMQQEGVKPDKSTFSSVLNTFVSPADLDQGKQVHGHIIKAGFESDICVGTALVSMYARCKSALDARQVFDQMPLRDVVSWNAMITGYAQHGYGREAFKLFQKMQQDGMKPDEVTFTSIVNACASLAVLEQGKWVHALLIKSGFVSDVQLGTALVDMYAKCGSLKDARQVFDKMPEQNVVSWTAMIAGYAQHGHGKEALQLFDQMQQEGVKPNAVTFIGVLSACSHVGLVGEGCHYFHSMSVDHGITPTIQHCGCMVDLLGRAGLLDEAEDFINKMPCEPGSSVWGALLSACRIHGNVERAERAAECELRLELLNVGAYMQLSNIYAAAGRWDDVAKVSSVMEDRGVMDDKSENLTMQMKEAGYVFKTR